MSDDDTSESRSSTNSDSDGTGGDVGPTSEVYSDSQRIGVYDGWPIHVAVSQEPASAVAPQEFAVNLFVPNENGENVDIARIDTDHRGCHMDRLYLPEGHDERREDYTVQYEDPDEAFGHFVREREWEYYTRRYDENHGLPEETKVYQS